jgi:hypothetical protein
MWRGQMRHCSVLANKNIIEPRDFSSICNQVGLRPSELRDLIDGKDVQEYP